MTLSKISTISQEISEAISSVLQVDVTIANEHLIRVSATGQYKPLIGQRLPLNSSFEETAIKKEPQFVANPNSDECIKCTSRGYCNEKAAIAYPIIKGEDLIGIIGLIAFDLEQKEELLSRYDYLVGFLNRISDLLVGNLQKTDYIEKLKIQDELIYLIINNLEAGIIYTNIDNEIQFLNSIASNILNFHMDDINIGTKNLDKLIPINLVDVNSNFPKEVKLNVNRRRESFIIRRNFVEIENNKVGYLYKIHKSFEFIQDAYSIMNENLNISFDDIIGESNPIKKVKNLAQSVSKSKSTVLLRGESGTGKELFARAIHNESFRNNSPFVAINCASIPENLLESELFGYEEGAFTGASKSGKIGKIELANNGTLFLDEIGDLPIHLQPKLLRVLQEEYFTRIGGKELISSDFRLITATNKNLEEMIERAQFREDLYYRLNVIPIEIPPLRFRGGDIDILSEYGLNKYLNQLNKSNIVFSDEVREIMRNYPWPGNIRELENCIEYLVNTVEDNEIMRWNMPKSILNYHVVEEPKITGSLKEVMDNYEKKLLANMLDTHGTSTESKEIIAQVLKINLSTLYRKLNKHNLQ